MKLLHLILFLLNLDPTIFYTRAEETPLDNSSSPKTTTEVPPSVIISQTNGTAQSTKEITPNQDSSTTSITTDGNTDTTPQNTTTIDGTGGEPSTSGINSTRETSTEMITSSFTRYTSNTTIAARSIQTPTENATTDPIPKIIFIQQTTRSFSTLKSSAKLTIQQTCPFNQTSDTLRSTRATPQTQQLLANVTSTPEPSTNSISSPNTTLGLTPAPRSTSPNTFTANKTTPVIPSNGTRKTAKTTRSKKKQKASKTTPRPTSAKPKTTFSRQSRTYSKYQWTGVRTDPTTREIDYRESNEFGEESFKKFMIRSEIFVDKSLIIKEFMDHESQVILITRPRFWGKSLNLNMLRKFFEIEVDPQGGILPQEQQTNRKLFCGGDINNGSATRTIQRLKISNIPEAMQHQGKHPVIQLNYHFIRNGSYEEMEIGMQMQIIRSFKRHFYLKPYFKSNPHLLDDSQRCEFERYYNETLTVQDLLRSIRFMSELLYKYFNSTVFVLIDEYDTPLIEAFRQSSDKPENLNKILQFYRLFYTNAFANNPYLAKGFITGKLRIANSNLFVNLTNIVEYTLLDRQFNQFYGFTEQEVDKLLEHLPEETSFELKSYYRGYNYGGQSMFNPWSIKQCIENNYTIAMYWLQTGILYPGNRRRYSLEGVQQDLKSISCGGCVQIPIKNEVSFQGLEDGRNFFNFILFTGYLSPAVKNPNGTYQLVKPNFEANTFYGILLGDWIQQHFETHGRWGVTIPSSDEEDNDSSELMRRFNETSKYRNSTLWSTTHIQTSEHSVSQKPISHTTSTSNISSSSLQENYTVCPDVIPEATQKQAQLPS